MFDLRDWPRSYPALIMSISTLALLALALSPDRMQWLAWAVTLILETAGAAAWWLAARVSHPPWHRALGSVLAVNVVTHPVFWFALQRLAHPGPTAVLLAEAVVVGIEAALYAWLWTWPPRRAVGLSLILNMLSWIGGIMLWQRLPHLHATI